jgi:D-alanine-D-alanine ligase
MRKFPVAVLGGGWSGERPISLRSAQGAAAALRERGWAVDAIDLWPDAGRPKGATPKGFQAVRLGGLLKRLRRRQGTVALLALHGPGGEDGRLQGLLDLAGIRYSGSGALASAVAMDKGVAKALLAAAGVPVPGGALLRRGEKAPKLRLPLVVKPASQGSSLGMSLVRKPGELPRAVALALKWDRQALLEPFLPGRELTVGVLGAKALPVVEILPQHAFYDFHSKYASGGSRHLCPAPIPAAAARRAQALALQAHRALGCRAYSRTDLILSPRGALTVLEVNTLPGLTSVSLLPDAARAAGLAYGQLLEAMLSESIKEPAWPSTKA